MQIRWSILFRTLCKFNIFRLLIHSKPYCIQNSRHSWHRKSLKYSLHRTLCNLDKIITVAYSNPSILRNQGKWRLSAEPYNTNILRTQDIFRTLSSIYYGEFYSEPYVTLAYLKPWHIQNRRHINILSNVYHEIFGSKPYVTWYIQCSSIFKTLVYSEIKAYFEPCWISNMEQFINSPVQL